MKIKDIYLRKGNCAASVIIAVLCVAVTFVAMVFPDTYQMFGSAYPIRYPWQICSGVFLHGSPELTMAGSIGHLIFNLLLVLSFGIMIEKILGSKRFVLMTLGLWTANSVTFYVIAYLITPKGETAIGAGFSGIAFSYGIIGLYSLIVLAKKNFRAMFRQVSFYLLINIVVAMLIMVNPFVAGVPSMITHIVAIVLGIVCILVYRKAIRGFFNSADVH